MKRTAHIPSTSAFNYRWRYITESKLRNGSVQATSPRDAENRVRRDWGALDSKQGGRRVFVDATLASHEPTAH